MDIVQNSMGTVSILGDLEHVEAPATRYPIVLCTEVLEHVVDIDLSFRGLRRLTMPGGLVMITVPFLFPEHMDPDDFRRLTSTASRSSRATTGSASCRATGWARRAR